MPKHCISLPCWRAVCGVLLTPVVCCVQEKKITCSEPGFNQEFVVDYDKLAIATGSQVSSCSASRADAWAHQPD